MRRLLLKGSLFVVFCFLAGLGSPVWAGVKEIGVPAVQNFQRAVYNAGTQNWWSAQGDNGIMYFANNSGLVRFDGQFWSLHTVPNGSNLRVLHYSTDQQRLYVGAFNDFGYFTNDSIGDLKYVSLMDRVPPEHRSFGDVWRIHEASWGVVFQAFEGLYFFKNDTIEVVKPRSEFHFSYYVNGVLYVFDRSNGLMEYRNGYLKKLPGGDFFTGLEVWSILPLSNDEVLIGTAKRGLFRYNGVTITPWNTPVNELLKKYQIYSALRIDDQHFAFGTIQNGLIISDKQGVVKQMINREKGLQNNTILSMCLDLDGNLWLGLDNGIDYVEINSPITLLQDFFDFGTGYTSAVFDGKLYLGTNQGLFYCDIDRFYDPRLSASDFTMVENTSGQVWSLQVIANQLYCGHNNGLFRIDGTRGVQINETPGCWALHAVPGYPGMFVEGTYNGMELYRLEGQTLRHVAHIKGVNYSCQELFCTDDRQVWLSHSYNGVKLFRLSASLDSLELIKHFSTDDGLPAPYSNRVRRLQNGDVVLTTSDGIYHYDTMGKNFYKSKYYNNLFANQPVSYLQEDAQHNIWYITYKNEGGVLRFQEDGTYKNVSYPFFKLKGKFIGSFFHFNVMDDSNVLIALERGFAHYNPKLVIDYRKNFNSVITSVSKLKTGEKLFCGLKVGAFDTEYSVQPVISFKDNSLRFSFSGIFYEGNRETQFSYQLVGFDSDWSEWQVNPVKEYTNLPEGDYQFRVRTQNKYGVISEPAPFVFRVSPPWYKSTQAYVVYFILAITSLWFLVALVVKRAEHQKKIETEEQHKRYLEREEQLKREALEAEKEIIRLKNERLNADVIHKDKELANTAMGLVQKNKHLNKIHLELKKIQADIKDETVKSHLGSVMRRIEKEVDNDESWTVFETNFEQVHEDFLKRLRELHPDISPKELKLAAYLRLNISTKEISELMNISPRGVEISRYRLRKKLNLDRQQNLTDYILSV